MLGFDATVVPNAGQVHQLRRWLCRFGIFATSDTGETIQKISDTTIISSDGATYTKMGSTTVGSDGSVFTQMGSFSSDGSTRVGSTVTGLGALFNDRREDKYGFDDHDDHAW